MKAKTVKMTDHIPCGVKLGYSECVYPINHIGMHTGLTTDPNGTLIEVTWADGYGGQAMYPWLGDVPFDSDADIPAVVVYGIAPTEKDALNWTKS
jgi:hypothetical protein